METFEFESFEPDPDEIEFYNLQCRDAYTALFTSNLLVEPALRLVWETNSPLVKPEY